MYIGDNIDYSLLYTKNSAVIYVPNI